MFGYVFMLCINNGSRKWISVNCGIWETYSSVLELFWPPITLKTEIFEKFKTEKHESEKYVPQCLEICRKKAEFRNLECHDGVEKKGSKERSRKKGVEQKHLVLNPTRKTVPGFVGWVRKSIFSINEPRKP